MNNTEARLIIISGLPGSGKSTCGRKIAGRLHITYIDYDTVIGRFLDDIYRRFYQEIPYHIFRREWRECTYNTFWDIIAENLRLGNSVAASAPLTKEHSMKEFFTEFKEKYGISINILSVITEVPQEVLHKRIMERGESRDRQKLEKWDIYYKSQIKERLWDPDREIIYSPEKEDEIFAQIRDFFTAEIGGI